jgi:drug/metabolite transporter (DMT)-like permease
MAKIFVILIIASIIESIGIAILSGGLKDLNKSGVASDKITVSSIAHLIKAGVTNGKILLGVALEAVFFGCLLYMLSQRDVSLIWPLTSLGFIVTTLAAAMFLNEKVSLIRWAGVFLIALGAGLTSYSESVKQASPPPTDAASTTLRSQ